MKLLIIFVASLGLLGQALAQDNAWPLSSDPQPSSTEVQLHTPEACQNVKAGRGETLTLTPNERDYQLAQVIREPVCVPVCKEQLVCKPVENDQMVCERKNVCKIVCS